MKRFLALAMAALMTALLLAACGSDGGDSQVGGGGSQAQSQAGSSQPAGEMENIVFAFPSTKIVDGIQLVEDEINKIIEPKLNVHVTFEAISMASYTEQMNLMMSSGEQLDVVTFFGTYSMMLSRNQFFPLDDLMAEYGQGIREVVGDQMLKATTSAGTLYAVPNNNGKAAVLNIVLREDILEENNISVDGLKQASNFEEYCENLDELGNIFAQLKEAEPDMVMLVPSIAGTLMFTEVPFGDNLGDQYGVLMPQDTDSLTLTNAFASDEFAILLDYARDWYQKGYILQDAATTQEASNTYLSSGRTVGYFIRGEEGQAEQITTATGQPVVSIKLLEAYINTQAVNGIGFGIASTSKHPEAAMKFLNETYTNPDVVNLLAWGIEGTHYEVQADGTIDFPEGVDANNTSYGLNMDWLFGNQFLTYIWGKGRDTTIYERLEYNNKNATFSPAMGFMYDSTPVRNELTALSNVSNEYGPGLLTGTVDPATELPKYLEALENAGLDIVIAEKQNQLDAWKEANG